MALSKIGAALGKHVSDLSEYKLLTQGSALIYKSAKDATHFLYFPVLRTADGKPARYNDALEPVAIVDGEIPDAITATYNIHTWGGGTDLNSCLCTRGYHDEESGYDGTCPVCDRISDSNAIRDLRLAQEMAQCQLTGEDRAKYEEDRRNALFRDSKVSGASAKFFSLAVVFNILNRKPELDSDGLPKFKLQMTNFSKGTVDNFEAALEQAEAENSSVAGREFSIKYPDYDDAMKRMGGIKVVLRDPSKLLVAPDSPLEAKVLAAVAAFDFETALETTFPYLKGTSLVTLSKQIDKRFALYDAYVARLQVDPSAQYLEYGVTSAETSNSVSVPATVRGIGFIEAGQIPVQKTVDSVDDLLNDDGDESEE